MPLSTIRLIVIQKARFRGIKFHTIRVARIAQAKIIFQATAKAHGGGVNGACTSVRYHTMPALVNTLPSHKIVSQNAGIRTYGNLIFIKRPPLSMRLAKMLV